MKKRRYRKLQKRLTYLVQALDVVRIEVEQTHHLLRELDPRVGSENIHDTIRRWTQCKTVWEWPADAQGPHVSAMTGRHGG